MAGLSCALSGASCCVLPTYFEATRFLSGYCGALCFIFCQVIIKDCPDIYSYFSSSTECLNFSHHNVKPLGVTCMSGHLREWRRDRYRTGQHSTNDVHTSLEKKKNNCDLVNHQHFRLVSSTRVKIDLVIVFIYKDPFSSRLSLVLVPGKRSLTNIYGT